MFTKLATLALLAVGAVASPVDLVEKRASCPGVHVFGARETTVSSGYGSAGPVVNSIVSAHSGATSEAISYPACGGQSSCGGISYANSVSQGTSAVITAVTKYAKQCPSTELVLVGYSQGAEIFDAALCGASGSGGSIASFNIKAAIFMGDPRFKAGAPYNVGTCKAGGFDQRSGSCGNYNSKIQSYCDVSASIPRMLFSYRSETDHKPLDCRLLTLIAAMATTRLLTRATAASMAARLFLSSIASCRVAPGFGKRRRGSGQGLQVVHGGMNEIVTGGRVEQKPT